MFQYLFVHQLRGLFTNDHEGSDSIHGWTNLLIGLLFDDTIARVRKPGGRA